jgi:GNAT superfamily N-acetyltransferase
MTGSLIQYRLMHPGEEEQVIELVKLVFDQFEAVEYSAEGIQEFYLYANARSMRERAATHFTLVAESAGQLVGIIEMRNYSHVALLFVHPDWHRHGIGRSLMVHALEYCRDSGHKPDLLTVNSSPYAVPFYTHFGFQPNQAEQQVHGIRFTPMSLQFSGETASDQ